MNEEHEALGFMIGTQGWQLYLARMNEEKEVCIKGLLDPSQTRKDTRSDDFLRGFVQGLRFSVRWPVEEVSIAVDEQRELEREQEFT